MDTITSSNERQDDVKADGGRDDSPSRLHPLGRLFRDPRARLHELCEQLTDDQARKLGSFLESMLRKRGHAD
jgi:hypothetical protein